MRSRLGNAGRKVMKLAALIGGALMVMAPTEELFGNYHFLLEINGLAGGNQGIVASFKTLSGMDSETEVVEVRDASGAVHKLPGRTKWANIVLKQGFAHNAALWQWYQEVQAGKFVRRDGAVVLTDRQGRAIWRYRFKGAFPVEYEGPAFSASRTAAPIETLGFAIESADLSPRAPSTPVCERVRLDLGGEAAYFRSVAGLKVETEVVDYQEGGVSGGTAKVPGRTRVANVVLGRSPWVSPDLWPWRRSAIDGKPVRRSGSIIIMDSDCKTEVARYRFYEGWPRAWRYTLGGGDALLEQIEIAIERLERG